MPRSSSSLALLLACACLLACPGDDGSDSGASTAADSGTGTGSAGASETTGAEEPDTSASSSSATSTGAPGDDSSTGTEGGPTDACLVACEHLVKCDVAQVPNCGIPCTGVGGGVAGCEAEYVAQQECVAALSCDDAQAWSDAMGMGSEHPCGPEDQALQACQAG